MMNKDTVEILKFSEIYQLKVQSYSRLSKNVGFCFQSPEFTIFGHKWNLKIYPNGIQSESATGYTSIYLICNSLCALEFLNVKYNFSVQNQKSGLFDLNSLQSEDAIFSKVFCVFYRLYSC